MRQGYSDWTVAFLRYQNHDMRTILLGRELDTIKKRITAIFRKVRNHLKASQLINLTDEDYANLYIHQDAARTAAAEIMIAPRGDVIDNKHLQNFISTTDPMPGKENSIALPKSVHAIEHYIAITTADAPAPDRNAYHALTAVRRLRFSIMSLIANKGVRKWLIFRYINTRHVGPESDPISFLVN